MSIERTFYCDGPDCRAHVRTAEVRPRMPWIFIEETGGVFFHPDCHPYPNPGDPWTFCSYDCVMKFAAKSPPPEVIGIDEDAPEEPA